MEIKSAKFIKSATRIDDGLENFSQIAFVGRSNVGKSSIINFITNRKHLAKTSATPGKTKLINYFLINKKFLLVDLPGYGYAQVSKKEKTNWGEFLEEYLKTSKNLKCVYLLLDVRRTPTEQDEQMLEFLVYNRINVKIVVTKIDTLSRSQVNNQIMMICSRLGLCKADIIVTSSQERKGLAPLLDSIEQYTSVTE